MQFETACLSGDSRCPRTSQTYSNEEMNLTTDPASRATGSERGGQEPGPDGLECCPWCPSSCAGREG